MLYLYAKFLQFLISVMFRNCKLALITLLKLLKKGSCIIAIAGLALLGIASLIEGISTFTS
jgi:hypothetical protein